MSTWEKVKRLLYPVQYAPGSFIILVASGVFFGLYGGLTALYAKGFFDNLQGGDWDGSLKYIGLMLLLLLIKNFGSYFVRVANTKFSSIIRKNIQYGSLEKYTTADNKYIESFGTGKIQDIISSGYNAWGNILENIPYSYINIVVTIITIIVLTVQNLAFRGTVIVFSVIIISLLISRRGGVRLKQLRKKTKKLYEVKASHMVKRIMSKFEILQQSNTLKERDYGFMIVDQILDLRIQEKRQQIVSFDIPRTIIELMQLVILFYVGKGMLQGEYTLGTVTLFWMIANMIKGLNQDIGRAIDEGYSERTHIDRLWGFVDHSSDILGYSTGSSFISQGGSFDIRNISYGYTNDQLIFTDFSLNIAGGSRIALVGPSGGGKSTLVKLIAGYLHPQSGQILVDGQALPSPQNIESGEHISLQSYYPHIGYLTQEPSVFDGTVWENLTYGLQENTEEQEKLEDHINHIIKLARCEFVHEFKDGLQTEIGEKGVRLSGGQRQRLAIAKIMLKDPDIILLDEPTSALDSENEELVTQALNELFKGKTVIVIAHRLQTVKHSDQILYIDGGQIIESGTHQELLDLGAKYATMVELQSGF